MSHNKIGRFAASLTISLIAFAARGTLVTVNVKVSGVANEKVDLLLTRVGASGTKINDLRVQAPGSIEVEPGEWSVQTTNPGLWHQDSVIHVSGERVTATVPVWRVGEIVATVRPGENRAPKTFTARFEPADSTPSGLPHGFVTCGVAGKEVRCGVPEGHLRLRIYAVGFVPLFFDSVPISRSKPAYLGSHALRRGTSLVGSLELPAGEHVPYETCLVSATPIGFKGAREVSKVNQRGIFHLDDLAAGDYLVEARAGNFSSAPRTVTILSDKIAELRDPVVLSGPHRLHVEITPPHTPIGKKWRLVVVREYLGDDVIVQQGEADDSGSWSSNLLGPGQYRVDVLTARDGVKIYSDSATIDTVDGHLSMNLQLRRVRGSVNLGEHPLQATLEFTNQQQSISTTSDADGRFSIDLPFHQGADSWNIQTRAESPSVRHVHHDVHIPADGTLHLSVPLTIVMGDVADGKGNPIESAIVTVDSPGRFEIAQTHSSHDGSFVLYGLDSGEYDVRATAFLKSSKPVHTNLSESGDASASVHLELEDEAKLHGRVFSDRGPVAGAEVLVFPDTVDRQASPVTTDVNGEFALTLPPETNQIDVVVAAHGYALRMNHTTLRGGDLQLAVASDGGTIVVPAPADGFAPVIEHSGVIVGAPLLQAVWNTTLGNGKLAITGLDPGQYTVCMLQRSELPALHRGAIDRTQRCTSGTLAPHGSMSLEPPKPAARLR